MIKINNIKETKCKLYYRCKDEDIFIGEITSVLQLNDVRIQIGIEKDENYFIEWKDRIILIDKYGSLNSYPIGFFDEWYIQLDKSLRILFPNNIK